MKLAAHGLKLAVPGRVLVDGLDLEVAPGECWALAVQAPQCLRLDEPLTHLDLRDQLAVMETLARRAAAGATVVMARHEPLWAARYCGHALLLYDSGRFRHGPVQDVLTQDHLEALYGCRLAPAASVAPLLVPIR
jgi:ABC-type cobalamin/Fe3+-siderophores transport system ATPase subunit